MKKSVLGIITAITLVATSLVCNVGVYAEGPDPEPTPVEVYNGSPVSMREQEEDIEGELFSRNEMNDGETYAVPEGQTLNTNAASIVENRGTVVENNGTIVDNFGTVTTNKGEVQNNYVSEQGGKIETDNTSPELDILPPRIYYNVILGEHGSILIEQSSQIVERDGRLWLGTSEETGEYFITVKANEGYTLVTDGSSWQFDENDQTWTYIGVNNYISINFKSTTPDPGPTPSPTPGPTPGPTPAPDTNTNPQTTETNPTVPPKVTKQPERKTIAENTNESVSVLIKGAGVTTSEAPARTAISTNSKSKSNSGTSIDLKAGTPDNKSIANLESIAKALAGSNVNIIHTENIYPRRDLSITENGSLQTLTWNNLPKNQAGPVYGVVYNQTDKAYVIAGVLCADGTAVFSGFKLRPASTITICK